MATKPARKSKKVKNLPVKSVSPRQSKKVKGGAVEERHFNGISSRFAAGSR